MTLGGVALALAAGGFAFGSRVLAPKPEPAPRQVRQYSDPAEVRAKLERIGRALVLYRQDYPAKPVGEWRSFYDAGLPPVMPIQLSVPGHEWTVQKADFFYEPHVPGADFASDFAMVYLNPTHMSADDWLASGPRQIILFDPLHPGTDPGRNVGKTRRTLVLRWDGTVEEVEFELAPPAGLGNLMRK
ncbi:MAG: hypothetical protein AB7T05_01595 [Fimbriimonadaceae bacterium]